MDRISLILGWLTDKWYRWAIFTSLLYVCILFMLGRVEDWWQVTFASTAGAYLAHYLHKRQ